MIDYTILEENQMVLNGYITVQNDHAHNQWLSSGSHTLKCSPYDLLLFAKPRTLCKMKV